MTDDSGLSVDDFVDYCHTQAGLLAGQVETMREEADDLLAEIDAAMAELRGQLEDHAAATEGPDGPSTPDGPGGELDLEAFEDVERDVEEKQLLVEAKQARMQAFQDLAAAYTDLAEDLEAEVDDGEAALKRVIEFEADRDAPTYFDERRTMLEAATESADDADS